MSFYSLLGFNPKKHSRRTEIMAGVTTFLTMSYILAVNPDILSAAGMDKGAVFTATALASALGTLFIAFLAKLPFAQAPGMGINAFFAFTLVRGMGYSWEAALAAVFVEGIIFIILTALNIREQIVKCIPKNLRFAISGGLGRCHLRCAWSFYANSCIGLVGHHLEWRIAGIEGSRSLVL